MFYFTEYVKKIVLAVKDAIIETLWNYVLDEKVGFKMSEIIYQISKG